MFLRILIAGLIVFGGFAIAGWVVAPAGWSFVSPAPKGDRLTPARADAAAPQPQAQPAVALAPPTPVPTTTFRQPAEPRYNTALLEPGITIFNAPRMPSSTPAAPPAERYDPRKPFRCPRGTPTASGPPTSPQIAQIETSLALSPEQEKLWRPVERALMEIAKHFETPDADPKRGKQLLSVERMQQIYWMAGPLVMSLRAEQKQNARHLACSMGLAGLAALI
jgi:hypothetical protein